MAHQPRSQGFYETRHTYFYDLFYKPYIFFLFFPTTNYYSFASASEKLEKATHAIEKEILFSVWYSEVILVSECVYWRKKRVHYW